MFRLQNEQKLLSESWTMSRHLIKLIKKILPPPIINFGSTEKFPTSLRLSENHDQCYFDLDADGQDLSHGQGGDLHHLHHRDHDHRHGELEGDKSDDDDFEGDGGGGGGDCNDGDNVMTTLP